MAEDNLGKNFINKTPFGKMEEKKKIPCQNAKVIGLICFCVQINKKKFTITAEILARSLANFYCQ